MAERRAIVHISGSLSELPTGDTLAGVSASGVTLATTPPGSPSPGDLWWDSDTGQLAVYYTDGDTSQWVGVSGPPGTAGTLGADGADGDAGADGTDGETEFTFSIPAVLTVGAGGMRWYVDQSYTISTVLASVGTAPTGASLIFDVNKNGTTIFTTQGDRPTIAAGEFVDLSSTPAVTGLVSGDYLTVDIDQIGSTVAGANAVVRIRVS